MPQAAGAAIEVIDGDMLTYAAVRDDRVAVKALPEAVRSPFAGAGTPRADPSPDQQVR